MRRRTYLPYRQGGLLLFGCIGIGNRSYGTAVHGLARGLNTAAAVSTRS
jgi:small ligand-binding sensory domain FIST